jgi:hypothetical protein
MTTFDGFRPVSNFSGHAQLLLHMHGTLSHTARRGTVGKHTALHTAPGGKPVVR